MKKIIITEPLSGLWQNAMTEAAKGCKESCSLIFADPKKLTEEDVADATALFGRMPRKLMEAAVNLEWQQLPSAGADADIKNWDYKHTVLTNAAGAYDLSVSEHMLAQTLAMIRRLGIYMHAQREHVWKRRGGVTSLEESTVMILGAGRIGSRYAEKVKALGAYTIGVKRTAPQSGETFPGYDEMHGIDSLDELLPRADIVAMVLPGGDATAHIMNERRLRLMKKGSYILNVGRGSAIEPAGLYKVLSEGLIEGAALDVTEPEPLPEDSPFWDMDNVIITPHSAGNWDLPSTIDRCLDIMLVNLKRYLNGEELINQVDKKLGY